MDYKHKVSLQCWNQRLGPTTTLNLLLVLDSLNRWGGFACCGPALRQPEGWAGSWWGDKRSSWGWGGRLDAHPHSPAGTSVLSLSPSLPLFPLLFLNSRFIFLGLLISSLTFSLILFLPSFPSSLSPPDVYSRSSLWSLPLQSSRCPPIGAHTGTHRVYLHIVFLLYLCYA